MRLHQVTQIPVADVSQLDPPREPSGAEQGPQPVESFFGQIALACVTFWFCGILFGLFAFFAASKYLGHSWSLGIVGIFSPLSTKSPLLLNLPVSSVHVLKLFNLICYSPGMSGLEAWPRPRGLSRTTFCGLGLEGPELFNISAIH